MTGEVMTVRQYRQGDVLLVGIAEPSAILRRVPSSHGRIVAGGEPDGNLHTISAGHVNHYVETEGGRTLIEVCGTGPVDLVHPEHRPIPIEPGWYEVHRQREYQPGSPEPRRVPAAKWPRALVRLSFQHYPRHVDLSQVRAEPDPELRRVLIQRFGPKRIMQPPQGVLVAEDSYGHLWRFADFDSEALTMVEVVNATPEPDGTHRVYWLRVPPCMMRPSQAVAWTFGVAEEVYRPEVES